MIPVPAQIIRIGASAVFGNAFKTIKNGSKTLANVSFHHNTTAIINIHEISIECEERTPLKTRTSKEFREYFDKIWNELNEEK